ncbi:hypothetical protein L1049_017595 [Liquidambar formosana]|uniref:Disease resistance protein RGA3 n=1 Tax=Liquidambar formosana TaxID=63359 RepID=A0AAP0S245_LIQFO
MAEFLIFAVGETLKKGLSLVAEEVSLTWGFREDLTRLGDSWRVIESLLRAAEQQPVRYDVVWWLNKLKNIAFDAEDVLDEIAYEGLRRKVELQNRMGKKVRDFLSRSNPIAFRLKMAHKVKKINLLLEQIKRDASLMGLVGIVDPAPQPRRARETTSFVDDSEVVVGRQNEVSDMVKMLIDSGNQGVLSIVPIVGMAGLGKTTVAQLVYHNDEVKNHFHPRMWVCVSENFEFKRILCECLESLDRTSGRMDNLDTILHKLREKLGGKRYLLVLDDVWNTDDDKWESLKDSLLRINNTTMGSKIIVTTRDDRVASIMGTLPSHCLGELSIEDCWSIFKNKAFANDGVEMTPELEEIGREIVIKCACIPLAAKVLGSMMHSKREKHEWELIQKSEIWKADNRIMQVLKLSFDNLQSPSLKQCFAYCSILQKDSDIEKDVLIQLWMAQGFLQPSPKSNLEMEDLGNEYFNTLLGNSLFQEATKDKYDNYSNCKMHDLVYDLAESILRFGNWISELNEENDELEIQHLRLDPRREIPEKCATTKVRSLFLMENNVLGDMLNFKSLRVLTLNGWGIDKLPISVGKLKKLRYLDVSWTKIKEFPKSIGKLYHLQTLRLEGCVCLKGFPNELKNLINLRHICFFQNYEWKKMVVGISCFFQNYECKKMPVGIGQLTCLQTLPYFYVGQEKGPRIGELGSLNKLSGELTIDNLRHVKDGEEARKAKLSDKQNIHTLNLIWGWQRESNNNDEHVLEGLQPHPNLKSLSICGFGGDKFPSWIMTMSIVSLTINKCPSLNSFASIHGLTSLHRLKISRCDRLSSLPSGLEFCTSLEELCVFECPSLESIPGELGQLCSLRSLAIRDCGKLKCLPWEGGLRCFTQLKCLSIGGFCKELDSFPVNFEDAPEQLEVLRLWGWPKLKSLPDQLQHLTALIELNICGYDGIEALPEWLGNFSSLEYLYILKCENLVDLPPPEAMRRLTKLKDLKIYECPHLEKRCANKSGLECSKIFGVPIRNMSPENHWIWQIREVRLNQ